MTRTTRNEGGATEWRLAPLRAASDVPAAHRGTPIESFMLAQNLGRSFVVEKAPTLFVATCIDSRVRLALPIGAAFELRSAGVRLGQQALFQIAFVVSVIGIRHVALVSHDDCAMTTLPRAERAFVDGLVGTGGWNESSAEAFFRENAPEWQRDDPIGNVVRHARELRERFPSVTIVPLHYTVGDGRLNRIVEGADSRA